MNTPQRLFSIAFFSALLAAELARSSTNTVQWFNAATNRIRYASGGTNYLFGHVSDSTLACYAQLIYAGADQTNNPAVNWGDGTSGDDVVIDSSWFGRGSGGARGLLYDSTSDLTNLAGRRLFVRAWTAPSADFAERRVPEAPTNYYGDSYLWVVPPPAEPPGFDDFNFGGAGGFNAATPPVTLAAQVACEIAATVRCAVSWSSLSGFVYRVDRAWGGGALDFITVSNNITAAPGIATYVEAATNSCPVLYRIGALRQTP